jgi:hypothetical protein
MMVMLNKIEQENQATSSKMKGDGRNSMSPVTV